MSRRSTPNRPPSSHSTSNSSPLISVSTITYIASWRGQLLICTIVLVVGAIYFVLQQPVSDYMRRRREKISRERQQELMSLEAKKEVLESPTVEKDKIKDRGREKKKEKDVKKRKGSLLKVSNTGVGSGSGNESSMSMAGPSSMESSPAPARLGVPTSAKKVRSRSRSPSPTPSPLSTPLGTPARLPPSTPENRRASATTPRIRLREPTSESKVAVSEDLNVEETPKSIKSIKTTRDCPKNIASLIESQGKAGARTMEQQPALSPEQIRLPDSPESQAAGPSRLRVPSEAGDFSDSTSNASELPSSSRPQSRIKSEGWSIMPEEGWLPPSTPVPTSKKKKNKKSRQSHTDPISALPPTQRTPAESPVEPLRRHTRQDSLEIQRPVNASPEEYEAHMDRMEVIIDRLRGELGASLASGRMAREAEEEARHHEEQMRTELSALRHRTWSSDKIRSREAELSNHLDQARKHSANLMQRVAELEKQIPKNGVPPHSPFMLMGPPSPFPQMNGHGGYPGNMSPMMPGSPFGMGFPSPGMGGPSRGNVPHPQMYPSPMLHPNAHAHLLNAANGNMNMLNGNGNGLHLQNTPQYRRTSTSDTSNDVFAGPLTPGIPSSSPSPYPYELGHGLPSGNMPRPMSTSMGGPGPNDDSEAITREERRTSIEASVLRKKSGHLVSPPDGQEGPEAIEEEKEGEVFGLGMGEVIAPATESAQEQHQNSNTNDHEQEHNDNGNGGESQDDDLQSSLSPPQHFGISTSGSGSNFTSNPPTPSPQSRLLTPSQLHDTSLAEEIGTSRSGSSTYDVENGNEGGLHTDIYPSESVSVHEGITTRQGSPVGHLWTSDLTDDQLAQRKHLAMMRAASEAKEKAKGDKIKATEAKIDSKENEEEKKDREENRGMETEMKAETEVEV